MNRDEERAMRGPETDEERTRWWTAPAFAYDRIECSICGKAMYTPECPHEPGQAYGDPPVVAVGAINEPRLISVSVIHAPDDWPWKIVEVPSEDDENAGSAGGV